MANSNKYEQTKSYCKFRGVITGLANPKKGYGFVEGVDSKGNKYRSLRFSIKTAEDNIIPVEIYGGVQAKAYFYSKAKKNTKEVEWDKRFTAKFDGYERIVSDYDKAKELYDTYHDEDNVVILGEVAHSEYTPKGKTSPEMQTKYVIKNVYPTDKVIDFKAENFTEEAIFEEEIVVTEIVDDTKSGKVYILAYAIEYGDKFTPCKFEVNLSTADAQFVRNLKSLGYGDFIKVSGFIHNRAVVENIDANDGWGQKARSVTSYVRAQEVTGAYGDTLIKNRFTLEEITAAIAETYAKTKAKNQNFNPVKSDVKATAAAIEQADDELPFNINL